jgi:hypothetical protein
MWRLVSLLAFGEQDEMVLSETLGVISASECYKKVTEKLVDFCYEIIARVKESIER